MYEVILKDGLGTIIAEDYTEYAYCYRLKIVLKETTELYGKQFVDAEDLVINKRIVQEVRRK